MSIERDNGSIYMNCDSCSAFLEIEDTQPFADLLTEARVNNWVIAYDGHEYSHTCKGCVLKEAGISL